MLGLVLVYLGLMCGCLGCGLDDVYMCFWFELGLVVLAIDVIYIVVITMLLACCFVVCLF